VKYDVRPNSLVCPVCLGLPGSLPVMNEKAVELALRMALALNCRVPDLAKWDRKHYYYPDLPKNYQISEYDQPLGVNGYLDIETSQGPRRIGIIRVHLEEDAGKLMHAEGGGHTSIVDLNRTGTPLLEVVSEPDVRTAEEARVYGESLRQLAVYLGVSGCNMQLGQMRFEPNISLKIGEGPDGKPRYTPISEIKNLNSFRSVERAVAYELARHREEFGADPAGYTLEKQGKSTRGWRDAEGVTFLQRSKEEAHDYRYLPEPDLVPVVPDRAWVEELRASVPELPEKRRLRFIEQYKLPEYDAGVLTADRRVADFYETLAGLAKDPKTASNWMMQDVMRVLNEKAIAMAALPMTPAGLAELLALVTQGTINRNTGAEVFNKMVATGKSAGEIVKSESLAQVGDEAAIEAMVDKALAANPGPVADYRGGKKAAFGRLMGEAMKAGGGKANPQLVKKVLERKLGG
jgi:aspartyl-tRNA(Asn)/glutamyl-tRNA(Gln) amidotransferase subunit B